MCFRAPDLLRAALLLLLHERGDYGYELRNRLAELSGISSDHGTVYRVLNHMEDEGLVTSGWERSGSGPARRRYRMTCAGDRRLDAWSEELGRLSRVLTAFETRYRRPAPEPEPPPVADPVVEAVVERVAAAALAGGRSRRRAPAAATVAFSADG